MNKIAKGGEVGFLDDGLKIVQLFLEKIEKLNDRERAVLIQTIDILNHPVFISGQDLLTPSYPLE